MGSNATFDHVTVAVFDLDEAIQFFGVLGFEVIKYVHISGATMDAYMGIPGMEADHVTLTIPDAEPHQEVQLLHFQKPTQARRPLVGRPRRHRASTTCASASRISTPPSPSSRPPGFPTRNQSMDFHDRKLVFLIGPANTVIELAQWHSDLTASVLAPLAGRISPSNGAKTISRERGGRRGIRGGAVPGVTSCGARPRGRRRGRR